MNLENAKILEKELLCLLLVNFTIFMADLTTFPKSNCAIKSNDEKNSLFSIKSNFPENKLSNFSFISFNFLIENFV
jgi:hypothetical protein